MSARLMGPEGVGIIFEAWECMQDGESLYINLLFLSPILCVYKFGSYDSSKF